MSENDDGPRPRREGWAMTKQEAVQASLEIVSATMQLMESDPDAQTSLPSRGEGTVLNEALGRVSSKSPEDVELVLSTMAVIIVSELDVISAKLNKPRDAIWRDLALRFAELLAGDDESPA